MIDADFLERAFSSVGMPETVAMLVGGLLFGAFVIWLSPAISSGATPISYVVLVFALAGLVFFVGRGTALYWRPPFSGRATSASPSCGSSTASPWVSAWRQESG